MAWNPWLSSDGLLASNDDVHGWPGRLVTFLGARSEVDWGGVSNTAVGRLCQMQA